MGAMSMTFKGTVEVAERDDDAHRAVLRVKSRDTGGSGYANADVTFDLNDGGGNVHTAAQISGKAASMGEGIVQTVLDALITDFTQKLNRSEMETMVMRRVREGEVPPDGATALQDDPDRPVFRANGPYDYVCVECGNVLAAVDGARLDDQARPDQVRALQDHQRRGVRRQGRDVIGFGSLPRKEDARFIRGQGQLPRRRAPPGAAARRDPAHAARARRDRLDRRLRGAAAPEGARGASPAHDLGEHGLDADDVGRPRRPCWPRDAVRFQGQEVAFVIADDHYSARDALELIDVEYEPLPVVVDPRAALEPDAPHPCARDGNRVFDWEAGDAAATAAAFARADVVVEQEMLFPRSHPAPLETCGAVADYDR